MKLIIPKYAADFKCIGGACSDNCCIGWEIGIDSATLDKYKRVDGEFGKRLALGIEDGDGEASFKMSGERCPFLNSSNLCDIIINLGEGYLCDICREHPRFYNVLGDTAFSGVGLSCEAAARLILSEKGGHTYIEKEVYDISPEPCFDEIFDIIMLYKQRIVDIFEDKTLKFGEKLIRVCREAESVQARIDGEARDAYTDLSKYSIKDILDLFSSLEYLDEGYAKVICEALERAGEGKISLSGSSEGYLENLMLYFVDRHLPRAVEDGSVIGKIAFAALSVAILSQLIPSDASLDAAMQISMKYSKEIEYNEDNTEAIMNAAESGLLSATMALIRQIF